MQSTDFFRITDRLMLEIPALSPPTLLELQQSLPSIKKIDYDHSPTIAVMMALATILGEDEKSIDGGEYKNRIVDRPNLLGFQQGVWLVKNQVPVVNAVFRGDPIDLPGLVAIEADGDQIYPCLRPCGHRYQLDWFGFANGFRSTRRIAVAGNL
jgi:hypothetical protein